MSPFSSNAGLEPAQNGPPDCIQTKLGKVKSGEKSFTC